MELLNCLKRWKAADDARESLPGEHAMVAAAGGALIAAAFFAPSGCRASLRAGLGGALLVRALSGRDGIARLLPPIGAPSGNATQPADPWPFPKSPAANAAEPEGI
ncbi:hypothetical protein [Xylophilus sp. GOD-11R]|uniref:hypothetical protein n=1 Tax=Xylophilus sp. GOD-11R TaxID=3089814 RepID=UPI00298D13B0|nr:hypothetical protein [Xylophilus sp. GOD-11R]WPB57480.1 hypothetical protein R9X41_02150 [Xylophilus sp. GOD-11R]